MRFVRALLALAVLAAGCAKFPSGGGGQGGTRLIFKMSMDGAINPSYVYIVALNPSIEDVPTTQGPIPVIAPPWGNGFVAGNVKYFIRWDLSQSPHFIIFKFRDQDLIDYFEVGVPVSYQEVETGGREIRFEIELLQIAVDQTEADTYRTLQVNFLTMDNVPQGNGGSKSWDALGDGGLPQEINEFINVPLRTSGVYDNRRFLDLEPRGDNPDPALDMVDFSVEVRPR